MALTLNDLQNYAYWNNYQGREKDSQQNRADYFLASPQYEKFIPHSECHGAKEECGNEK